MFDLEVKEIGRIKNIGTGHDIPHKARVEMHWRDYCWRTKQRLEWLEKPGRMKRRMTMHTSTHLSPFKKIVFSVGRAAQ